MATAPSYMAERSYTYHVDVALERPLVSDGCTVQTPLSTRGSLQRPAGNRLRIAPFAWPVVPSEDRIRGLE